MTSVQDRLNINRVALDKWTKREQLCLASAVSCSGDQNWMTVSRSLKLLCGAHHPPDWFSQKLCAVKYGELLENVETPKRKKRTTSDNGSSVVETPTDSILRRLTEERIQELKSEIREQQETYAKLYTDVVHLQTGNSNEEQIRAMWMEIEREQEQDRLLKARKQMGANDMQRNWRQGQFQQQKQQQMTITQVKQEDMEIDETCKPQGTSPLLSSLLKSSSPSPQVVTTSTTSTVRVSAPTITNLLTGGVISSSSASSSSASSPASSQGGVLPSIPFSKPLTGPGPVDSSQAPPQIVLSPSQSAPTLSMLLEKTKQPRDSPQPQTTPSTVPSVDDIKTEPATETPLDAVKGEEGPAMEDEPIEDGALTPTKEEEQQLMEVFKNLMPDNIDELADILTNNTGILNPGILEEESILEGVESLMDETQEVDDHLETKLVENDRQESKNPPTSEEDSRAKIKDDLVLGEKKPTKSEETTETVKSTEENLPLDEASKEKVEEKIETISSDDSSDNVPLAAHTKEAKAPCTAVAEGDREEPNTETTEQVVESQGDEGSQPDKRATEKSTGPALSVEETALDDDDTDSAKNEQEVARKGSMSDSSDVIIIPTDDESNDGKAEPETKKTSESPAEKDEEPKPQDNLSQTTTEGPRESPDQTITSICLPDTDDDSSTFETPLATPKEDRSKPQTVKKSDTDVRVEEEAKQTLAIRKLRDRDRSESPLVEDDTSDHSVTVRSRRRYSSTPVMDSIPNSPASSDDREFKAWKKSLMTVYNNLLTNKNAAIFLRPFTEENYKQVCNRPMDLQIIKRHIENGTIKNVTDFQRDVFLMCNNAIIAFKKNSSYANMARDLMHEFVQLKEQIIDAKMEKGFASSSPYTPGMKVRGSARKSQRLP